MSTTDPTDRSQAGIAAHWLTSRPARTARPHRATDRPMGRPRQAVSCTVPGCHRPHRARGFCNTHWARVYCYGWPDAETPPPAPPRPPILCSVDDCTRRSAGRTLDFGPLCGLHRQRVLTLAWDTPERKRVQS
jgi:hypothetical protein